MKLQSMINLNLHLKLSFLLLSLLPVSYAQTVLRTWKIEAYTIELVEYFQVEENGGPPSILTDFRTTQKYRTYAITKNDVPLSVNYRVSKDSCVIDLLEFTLNRPKDGHVGNRLYLNLCSLTVKEEKIIKPVFRKEDIIDAHIRALDSVTVGRNYVQNTVTNYGNGEFKVLHEKMREGICVFQEANYLIHPYRQEEFIKPFSPRFEISLKMKDGEKKILLYWSYFIIDGYCYGSSGSYQDEFDVKFWEANELLNSK